MEACIDKIMLVLILRAVLHALRGESGENEGLNLSELAEKMGVEDLKIAYCSTGTVTVSGYNRTLKGVTPSVTAYEMGSVFHLTFRGRVTPERARSLMHEGIGMKRNEGFGRVLFLKDYENIRYKIEGEAEKAALPKKKAEAEDPKVLKQLAVNYSRKLMEKAMIRYTVEHPLKKAGLNNSQVGTVESLIFANRYHPAEAKRVLENYFTHANEKEAKKKTQNDKMSVKGFGKYVLDLLNAPLSDILGADGAQGLPDTIFGYRTSALLGEEELKLKLELLLMLIRYDNKKEEVQ